MRFKALIRNINLFNVLLLSISVTFAVYTLFPLLDVQVKYTLPPAKKISEGGEMTESPAILSLAEYANIAEENLFHPERKIPVEKVEQKPLPKPEFVLYGTLITDDLQMAYLEDLKAPFTTPGRGKRQAALRKGDSLSGYTLKEIEEEKIVMARGEESIVVHLNDPNKLKTREVQASSSVQGTQQPATQHRTTPVQAPKQETSQAQPPFSQLQATPETPRPTEKQQAVPKGSEAKKNFADMFKDLIKR
jgi:hypothetical protein